VQVAVTIRLYGYMETNTINKGKRDEIVKNLFIENKYVNRKLKTRRGGGNSVLRVPVVWLIIYSGGRHIDSHSGTSGLHSKI
jgi:hypothetical protein